MSCQPNCTQECIEKGIVILRGLIGQIVLGALGSVDGTKVNALITQALDSVGCIFPQNLKNRISLLISQITTQTGTVVKDVLIYSVLVIFVMVLLLTLFTYLTFYIFTPGAMLGFFIGSFFVIVIAALLLYFGILNIYDHSSQQILNLLTELENLLTQAVCAGESGFCCFASIYPGSGCTCCASTTGACCQTT